MRSWEANIQELEKKAKAYPTACKLRLKRLSMAKEQAALATRLTGGDAVTEERVLPYVLGGKANMKCPQGGVYSINVIGESPVCSHKGH
jgi:hypothetical protein